MWSRDHLPRIEHCECLSFWSSFRPNSFPIFIIVGGNTGRGWVLCFQFGTILKEERVHVVLCAVVLFCCQSILCQYCASVLAITVVQPCLSCNDSVFNNTSICMPTLTFVTLRQLHQYVYSHLHCSQTIALPLFAELFGFVNSQSSAFHGVETPTTISSETYHSHLQEVLNKAVK